MKVQINTQSLTQSLMRQIKAKGLEALKVKAIEFISKIHKEAKDWKAEIRKKLSKPAISRGYFKGSKLWLNLHNKASMNDSFPMLVDGHLRNSLKYRVTQRTTKDAIVISVKRWFEPTMNRGRDYGEELNTKHHLLKGYKERAYSMLDTRIRKIK